MLMGSVVVVGIDVMVVVGGGCSRLAGWWIAWMVRLSCLAAARCMLNDPSAVRPVCSTLRQFVGTLGN